MSDSIFARLGYDPVRIHAHLTGVTPTGVYRPHKAAERDAAPAVAARPASEEGELTAGTPPEPAPPPTIASDVPDATCPAVPRPEALSDETCEPSSAAPEAGSAAGDELLAPPEPPYVPRTDRWNKFKMAEFLRELAATHSVSAAARAVGMSRNSAYKLRARLKGEPFDIAWEAAFRHGYDNLAHAALERAINGVEVPHYHGGELIGTSRKFDERLTVALLAMRNRAGAPMLGRYGAAAEYWSEAWERMLHRVETGGVTWADERDALSEEEFAALDLPDERRRTEWLIARNLPDEPGGRFGR